MREPTDDVFLGGRLSILQPAAGYRAGLDAVLLAASLVVAEGDRVLDAGAGVGVVGLCVAARVPGCRVTLVERDPGLAGLAKANIERNALTGFVEAVAADVLEPAARHEALGLFPGGFDHVAANPPYLAAGSGRDPIDPGRAASHVMPAGALQAWGRFLARMARDGGVVTMIHRADALHQVLDALAGRFGALDVLPVQPRASAFAHRVLVRGIKGSRRELRLLAPLVVHGEAGTAFAPRLEQILRHGAALEWP